jgi:hypothetical protein
VGDAAGKAVKKAKEPIKKGIKAFHGSPHDFDRFSRDKIGTGEGAQAYGHGLYFAEQEDVAKQYRDQLANGWRLEIRDPLREAGIEGRDLDSASQMLSISSSGEVAARDWENWTGKALTPEQKAAFDEAYKRKGGRMYEVNINANPDDFLDWDKPLSEQPEVVQRLAREADLSNVPTRTRRMIEAWRGEYTPPAGAIVPEPTGNVLHSALTDYGTDPARNAAMTRSLAEQGIPGIKYLDAGSRGAGDGSRNYVVFDDSLIEIVRKYGIAAAIAGGVITREQAEQMQAQGAI